MNLNWQTADMCMKVEPSKMIKERSKNGPILSVFSEAEKANLSSSSIYPQVTSKCSSMWTDLCQIKELCLDRRPACSKFTVALAHLLPAHVQVHDRNRWPRRRARQRRPAGSVQRGELDAYCTLSHSHKSRITSLFAETGLFRAWTRCPWAPCVLRQSWSTTKGQHI